MSDQGIRRPRGTTDYYGQDAQRLVRLRDLLMDESRRYGAQEVDPPVFEESRLFHRSVGESSDIVRKETFDLVRKGDKDYTLRPEFTAGVNRMALENKLYASPDLPLRLSYFGKVFRYERPQSGRLREFYQYGVEFLDRTVDLDTSMDCLLLSLSAVERALGKGVRVKLNFLGSFASRERYKHALYDFFSPLASSMCEDCQSRLKTNPLRILDCKVPEDQKLARTAPRIEDYLDEDDRQEYQTMLRTLDEMGVDYEKDDGLVRGLDYYTGLVWEIYDRENPSFPALGGGGKYASLMKDIGGPDFEGIGFSLGVERLLLDMDEERRAQLVEGDGTDFFVIDLERKGKALRLMREIRLSGRCCLTPSFSRALGGAFKMADRFRARKVLIVFEDGHLELKDMESRTQERIAEDDFLQSLKGEN